MTNNLKKSFSESIKRAIEVKELEKKELKRLEESASRQELEQALTVLLVELASSDQNFDQEEYQTICMSLKRLFNTDRSEARRLINQANTILSQMRGTTVFAYLLRDNLEKSEREVIADIIDELVATDGEVDDFEIFHRERIKSIILS
jgi:uncharacterized tellurite resistance protein B-like protein